MKILKTKVMRGPNYWSNYRKQLIVMRLDLEKYEDLPTDKIPGFYKRIMRMLPSLYEHRCSEGKQGGLCERMVEGTWLGHVVEHVALELQTLAGMDCGYGRTRSTRTRGVYNVVFSYCAERAGRYAAQAAVDLVEAIAEDKKFDLKKVLNELAEIWSEDRVGPSTQSILDEAKKRNIPVRRMDSDSLYMLGWGKEQQLFRATVMGTTSNLAVEAAGCKWYTKEILGASNIPVPKGITIYDKNELESAIEEIGFPIVIKPIDGNHGRGITANIRTKEMALKAMKLATKISDKIIVEKYVAGDDYRFLVINYKLTAVAKRTPAMVTGDGVSTVKQLVQKENANPARGEGHEKVLTTIKLDHHTKSILKELNLTYDSVLPAGAPLMLKKTANLSTGGTSTDVTDQVHPSNVFMAERIARLMQLDVCGIDIMAADVTTPITHETGAVIEVNAGPGFRMHTHPSEGSPRNVAGPVVDMLFPKNTDGRIPLVAITGTNGKTTTTRLTAHLAQTAGRNVGYTTTEGIYINDHLIVEGDCSGPVSAETVLKDPMVDYAVLECARGGILRSGLAFDNCSISIVTNITEDHLGLDDIDDIESYAQVKEVVARSTADNGYAILNAEDDRVYAMREIVNSKVILFGKDNSNPRITDHCAQGGTAITVEDGFFTVISGELKKRVLKVTDAPITFGGTAGFMIENILPAVGAAVVSGFSMDEIRKALTTFYPSPEQTPGRMNVFSFGDFQVILDYAHNASGFMGIENYMKSADATKKTCVIAATGDRREDDIRNQGEYAARIFDEIIIRHDKDGRGRSNEELTGWLMEGINRVDREKEVHIISDEESAIDYAISNAIPGSVIFASADHVMSSIAIIRGLQKKAERTLARQAS